MDAINIRKQDQILMSLVHYFVTKENYSPIYVQGVRDEIWLEKLDGPYRVIRINSNRIFNNEQFQFDQFRIREILKQIKKKTLSFSINALNINLNEEESITIPGLKNVDNLAINSLSDIENNKDIIDIFPGIKDNLYKPTDGLELIFNVTNDINNRTEQENEKYKQIFSAKKCWFSYFIIIACVVMFLVEGVMLNFSFSGDEQFIIDTLTKLGACRGDYLRFDWVGASTSMANVYRLISYSFLHAGWAHIFMNMYSIFVIGPQTEARFGTGRFAFIYIVSAICGGLLTVGVNTGDVTSVCVGASGAIFGILGALVYFGMKFRLYFKDSLLTRLVPVIVINLIMSFMPGIDAACHIGGLIAGYLAAMAVGIPLMPNKQDNLNGSIILAIFVVFLLYLAFVGI